MSTSERAHRHLVPHFTSYTAELVTGLDQVLDRTDHWLSTGP
jgi:hypothetical protein